MSHTRTMVLAAALAAMVGQAQAEYVFTFGGTVVSGDNNEDAVARTNDIKTSPRVHQHADLDGGPAQKAS